MRFTLGAPPDDSDFQPEQEGWTKLRDIGPGTLMLVGSLAGLPLAALFSYSWSRLSPAALTFTLPINAMSLGRWSILLLPLVVLLIGALFFAAVIFTHELIHALACPGFGLTSATILGVWPSRVICYASHAGPISFWRGIVLGIAPFLVLSVFPLALAAAGGPRWTFLALVSVTNAMMCGGDAVITGMFLRQIPFNGIMRNKGWNTWWRSNSQ